MLLDTIVTLLQVLVGCAVVTAVGAALWAIAVLHALGQLSRRLDCVIQQASVVPAAATAADEPDGSKLPELDPWRGDVDTIEDLIDRSP